MAEHENLPAVIATHAVVVLSERRGSLVGRGLVALKTKPARHNIVPEDDVDVMHELTLMFDALFGLGYITLESATKYINKYLKERLGFTDQIPDEMYKTAYDVSFKQNGGNAGAQKNLGWKYYQGEDVPQDYEKAMMWYRLAAEQNFSPAQNNLGHMYESGQGVPQDYAEAVKWYRLAADQGHANAQYNIGRMYESGQGAPKDFAAAVKWYRLAAEQCHAHAQYNLGMMYDNGTGVPRKKAQAITLYQLAAAQGHVEAQNLLKLHDEETQVISKKLIDSYLNK